MCIDMYMFYALKLNYMFVKHKPSVIQNTYQKLVKDSFIKIIFHMYSQTTLIVNSVNRLSQFGFKITSLV